VTIFRQSDIVGIPKLAWILSCFTPYSLMLRAHTFKDAENKKDDLNMGTFNYPILMAADILGYDMDVVPVGKDQLQHLEMARDMARYVNHHFKADIFVEPKPIIDDSVATIVGTDGRKMSKSYNNTISMFESSADLKKKIATIPTDSLGLDDPKNPDTCNVFALIKTFGEKEEIETIRAKYLAGGYGY
jgi:tryptophanyl-tRNA synthetase